MTNSASNSNVTYPVCPEGDYAVTIVKFEKTTKTIGNPAVERGCLVFTLHTDIVNAETGRNYVLKFDPLIYDPPSRILRQFWDALSLRLPITDAAMLTSPQVLETRCIVTVSHKQLGNGRVWAYVSACKKLEQHSHKPLLIPIEDLLEDTSEPSPDPFL